MAKEKETATKLTKYERARILGSRALQISMGAPYLVKLTEKDLEELRYSPLEIAKKELEAGILPLRVVRVVAKRERIEEKETKKEEAAA